MIIDYPLSLVNCDTNDMSKADYAQCLRCDRMLSCLERYSKSLDGLLDMIPYPTDAEQLLQKK